jgi:hypothetical protein
VTSSKPVSDWKLETVTGQYELKAILWETKRWNAASDKVFIIDEDKDGDGFAANLAEAPLESLPRGLRDSFATVDRETAFAGVGELRARAS